MIIKILDSNYKKSDLDEVIAYATQINYEGNTTTRPH